jgi:hypothetical protein
MRAGTWLAVIATVVLAGCGSSGGSGNGSAGSPTGAPSAGAWTGFGAKLADWETAHPKQTAGCRAGTCFGNALTVGGTTIYRFQVLYTTGPPDRRVNHYEQTFREGTTAPAAKTEVLKLMPSDTHTLSFSVEHPAAESCAFWDLQSRTLGKYLSGPNGDASGVIGIELQSPKNSNGESLYSPNDVRTATVWTRAIPGGSVC